MTHTPDAQKIVLLEAQLEAMEIRARELESALDDAQLLGDERSDEIAALKAELAQYDLGEWEDDRLKEWLPNDAEQELIARLTSRSENWEDEARSAQAELAALREEWAELEVLVNGTGWQKWAARPTQGQRVRAWAIVSGEYDADEEVILLDSTGELALAWWQPEPVGATAPAQ